MLTAGSQERLFSGCGPLQAAERVLQYVRGTYDQGITYFDLGDETKNKLIGWLDSDFGSDPDTRKSMTGYLMSLNGGAIPGDRLDKEALPSVSLCAPQIDVKVHYLHDLVRDGHVKLVKCAGTKNVSDALTKI